MITRLMLVIAGALLLVDLVSLASGLPSLIRWVHHKLRGYIEVPTPADLWVAAANGLIRKGDKLVVAWQHEGNEGEVTCFAISSELVGLPAGTVFRVVSVTRKRLVLEKISLKKSSS